MKPCFFTILLCKTLQSRTKVTAFAVKLHAAMSKSNLIFSLLQHDFWPEE